jgi:predicted ATPase
VDVIGRLAAKSLVIADRGSLRLLVTIRDYGSERLDELGASHEVRRAHAEHLAGARDSPRPRADERRPGRGARCARQQG